MRHVRYDEDFFRYEPGRYPTFRASVAPREAVRTANNLPVLGSVAPDEKGVLPAGSFLVVRSHRDPPVVAAREPHQSEQPGVLVFGLVVDHGTVPKMAEGLATVLIDLPVALEKGSGRAFCAALRGDERLTLQSFGPEGAETAHIFKGDGSYEVRPWEAYREEWKLRRLNRLCSD